MIRLYPNEVFKEIEIEKTLKFRYAISNRGRLVSFLKDIKSGNELKGSTADGYRIFRYNVNIDGVRKPKYLFFYKLIAQYFIPKQSEDQKYVLHLDYVRDNDVISNLQWATYDEMITHGNKSPKMIQNRKNLLEFNIKSDGKKLTSTQVIRIKKIMQRTDRTTRNKIIAKQFNISETHLSRIVRGENWGHIKV